MLLYIIILRRQASILDSFVLWKQCPVCPPLRAGGCICTLPGNYNVMGVSLYLPTSGLLPLVNPYILWDWSYSYRARVRVRTGTGVNLQQLVSFSVVWLLDSSHYLGLPADNCIIKYLEDGLHVANFPPWDQKGKGVVWRERRNAGVWQALGGSCGPQWLLCEAQQTGLEEEHVSDRVSSTMLSWAKYGICAAPLCIVLKWHESAIVTVQGFWTFLLDWEGFCF